MFGPLKEDTSKTCKIKEWTHAQATEKCVPVQYVLYGSKNVARLQAIKETIDPNYMLDCQSCIGTATLAKAELGPADGGSEAGETKPTDSGEASDCSYYSTLLCLQTSLCFCMVSIFFLLL